MGVVAVKVRKHDDVRTGGLPGRSLTSDSTEMADPGRQDGVEQEGCAVILPGHGAVPPPCHCAAHSVPARRDPRTAAVPNRSPASIAANRRNVTAISSLAVTCANLPLFCTFDSIRTVD